MNPKEEISDSFMPTDMALLFDKQFSIMDLETAIEANEKRSNTVMDAVRNAVKKAASEQNREEDRTLYVVDMDESIKDAMESGDFKLDTNSSGEMFAQLRDKDGHFGKRLPIKEELIEQGISVEAAELALQMDVVRDQLKNIIVALNAIEGKVTEVLQGQQNDRLGLFYSGLSLYMEAGSIHDKNLRQLVISQSLKALSDANSQMIQELRTSVEFLVGEKYKKAKKITEKIDEHLAIIHQCYDVVYRSSFLKATIYYENEEIQAMLTAINEYGRFVERMIIPYAGKLSELDRNNQFIEKGTWGRIGQTLEGCQELKKQITQNHTYYLSLKEVS